MEFLSFGPDFSFVLIDVKAGKSLELKPKVKLTTSIVPRCSDLRMYRHTRKTPLRLQNLLPKTVSHFRVVWGILLADMVIIGNPGTFKGRFAEKCRIPANEIHFRDWTTPPV